MAELAPIVLFAYNRPEHLAKTLYSLSQNRLADKSTLYIYCDGPKINCNEEELKKIAKVRETAKEKQWCKTTIVIEAELNKGLAASIKNGITEIIEQYGKVIVLEDDLILSSLFLTYINKALIFYIDKKSVFSISAFNYPSTKMPIPDDYHYDVFVSLRNSSWGWATWNDRWKQIDWNVSLYSTMIENKHIQEAFNRGGDDVFGLLQMQQSGKLNIWSIQFTLAHFVNHAISIAPVISYVDNNGLDGSGENCSIQTSLGNKTLNNLENIRFLDILYEDKRIINAFYNVNCRKKRPLWQKIANRMLRIIGRQNIFVIKNKIYH
jgi:hypothetical protein